MKPDEFSLIMLRMCFYGGVDIYVSLLPDGVSIPGNLAREFVSRRIERIFPSEAKIIGLTDEL